MKLNKVIWFYLIYLITFSLFLIMYFSCTSETCHYIRVVVSLLYQVQEPFIVLLSIYFIFKNKKIFFITLPLIILTVLEYYFKGSFISSDDFERKAYIIFGDIFSNIPIYEILSLLVVSQFLSFIFYRKDLKNVYKRKYDFKNSCETLG